jgi:hypothetical protein
VEPIPDKEDSTKIRSFCFVEFFEHKQAQAAYATCHLEAQSLPTDNSAPLSASLSDALADAYSASSVADGDDSVERSSRSSSTATGTAATATTTATAAAADAKAVAEDALQGSRHSSDGTTAAPPAVQCDDGAVTDTGPASLSPSRRSTLTATAAATAAAGAGADIATAAAPAAAVAAAPAAAVATGPTAPTTVSTAVPLVVDGVVLKVDWADPLRYHIHLHGGIKGPREPEDSVERSHHRHNRDQQHNNSSSSYYRDAGGWPSSHPPRFREQQYYGQQLQQQQQQRRQQQQMLQYGHSFAPRQQQQWPRQPQQHGMYSQQQQQPQYAQQQQQHLGRPPAGPASYSGGGYGSGSYGSGGYPGLDEATSAHLLMQQQLQQQVVSCHYQPTCCFTLLHLCVARLSCAALVVCVQLRVYISACFRRYGRASHRCMLRHSLTACW